MPTTPVTGRKFLITTYKSGGESNFAKLVPLSTTTMPNAPGGYPKEPPNADRSAYDSASQLETWWRNRPAHRYPSATLGHAQDPNTYSATNIAACLTNTRLNNAVTADVPTEFALHPRYQPIMEVWTNGDLAIVPHCGAMIEPLPDFVRAVPNYGTVYQYPKGIGAHDTFQIHHTFMNGTMTQSSAGWVGRVMDKFADSGLSSYLFGLHTVVINPAQPHYIMHIGDTIVPFTLPGRGPVGSIVNTWPPGTGGGAVDVSGGARGSGTPVALSRPRGTVTGQGSEEQYSANIVSRVAEAIVLAADPDSVRHTIWKNAFLKAKDGSTTMNPVQTKALAAAITSTFQVDQFFDAIGFAAGAQGFNGSAGTNMNVGGDGFWKSMFHRIARMIELALRDTSGAPIRMAFSAAVGDYDTHGQERNRFEGVNTPSLVWEYAEGVRCLRNACIHLGCWNDVVLTDLSDFGRTLWTQGGEGTDHAWAAAMFIAGGKVRGKNKDGSTGILGKWPARISTDGTGTRDWTAAGIMYPYHSHEQVYDDILEWFGLTVAERNEVMVHRPNFVSEGFLNVLQQ